MNPEQLLEQLAPLRAPDAVGLWPLAPGWWAVIALIGIALFALAFWLFRRHQRAAYRRHGVAWLSALEAADADLETLSKALKATAVHVYDPRDVASLSGEAWPEFLRATCKALDAQALHVLARVHSFDPDQPSPADWDEARRWMKQHEVSND